MARKNENAQTQPEATSTETTAPATPETTQPAMTPEERAKILADKQAHGQLGKVWKMKGGTDIPQRFDANEAQQYEAKLGATPEETMRNMLVFANGDQQAVLDSFNAAHRLAAQKSAKDLMKDPATTLADVQDELHGFLSGARRRGTGKVAGAAKARAEKAEAKATAATSTANEMLEELRKVNPEAAAKYEQRLAGLTA